jgi:hypothetical protein
MYVDSDAATARRCSGDDILKRAHLKRDATVQQRWSYLLPQNPPDSKNKPEGTSFQSIYNSDASSIDYSKYVADVTYCLEDLCKKVQSDLQEAKIETGKLFMAYDDQHTATANSQDENVSI